MEFIGKVVSTKMEKTAVVVVERLVSHPLYKKKIHRSKKFSAHDELGVSVGDKVKIESIRPVSKNKHFKIVEVLNS